METVASEELSVRRVRAGDGEALHSVFIASIHELAANSYTAEQIGAWTSHITPVRLEARLTHTIAYVAERGGELVGFGALDLFHGELDFLYVHPGSVRKGIGRRLAEVIEREATRQGLETLELTASLNATAAYEHLGYRRVRDMTKTIDGVKVPCVRMAKKLRAA